MERTCGCEQKKNPLTKCEHFSFWSIIDFIKINPANWKIDVDMEKTGAGRRKREWPTILTIFRVAFPLFSSLQATLKLHWYLFVLWGCLKAGCCIVFSRCGCVSVLWCCQSLVIVTTLLFANLTNHVSRFRFGINCFSDVVLFLKTLFKQQSFSNITF